MTLREVTRTVIGLVENVSGCPVVVSEDASLKTLAASRIARGLPLAHAYAKGSKYGIMINVTPVAMMRRRSAKER